MVKTKKGLNFLLLTAALLSITLPSCGNKTSSAIVNSDVYTLTFDFNDDSSRPYKVEVEKGKSIEQTAIDTPLRTGYTFVNWFSDKTDGNAISFPYTPTGDTTVYAHWTPAVYQAKFNLNYEGCGDPTVVDVNYKESVNAPAEAPTRDGYNFRYWSTRQDGSERATFPYTVTKDIDFYAYWVGDDVKIYTITLNYPELTGAPDNSSVEVEEGQSTQLPNERINGYDFIGWSTTSLTDENPEYKTDNLTYTPTGSVTNINLYAVYKLTPLKAYFRYNYVDSPDTNYDSTSFYAGDEINAPAVNPTRSDYTFAGWYTSAKGGTKVTFPTTTKKNAFYYAHWTHDLVTTDKFQAEYTYLSPDTTYYGYSGSTKGDGCILDASTTAGIDVDAYPTNSQIESGKGFCVSYQYSRQSVLTFEIEATEAISNASLIVNWACERDGLTFGPTGDCAYAVKVNGTAINYTPIAIPSGGNNSLGSFKEYTLSTSVSLNKGLNTITMQPENDNALMTMQSAAPLTDYIRIDYGSTGKLSWSPIYDNINGK